MNELSGDVVNVILVVGEGRGMPQTLSTFTIIAKFNDRALNLAPVTTREGQPGPQFHSQVSWMINKKELRRLRSSNTRIRIEVHMEQAQVGDTCLGFILLNPKSAHIVPRKSNKEVPFNWHRLLSVPWEYRAANPEINLTLTIRDAETIPTEPNLFAEGPDADSLSNLPIVYLPDGYIKVGDCGDNPDLFLLSIVIQVACNLDLLLPEVLVFSQQLDKYYISFSMFGIVVKTKPFSRDLHNTFPMSEKIVLRLRSTYECIQDFFAHHCQIVVHFYCGRDKLGVTALGIHHLLEDVHHEEFEQEHNGAVSMEEKCIFKFPSQHGMVPTGTDHRQPYIEVEMTLRQMEANRNVGASESSHSIAQSTDSTVSECTNKEETNMAVGDYGQHSATQLSSVPSSPREFGDHASAYESTEVESNNDEDEVSYKASRTSVEVVENRPDSQKTISPPAEEIHNREPSRNVSEWKLPVPTQQRLEEISHPINTAYQQYALAVIVENISWKRPMPIGRYFFKFKHPKAATAVHIPADIDTTFDDDFILENVKMKLFLISTAEQIRKAVYSWPAKLSLMDANQIPIAEEVDVFTSMLLCKDRREFFFPIELKTMRTFESLARLNVSMYLQEYGLKDMPQTTGEELLPVILDERLALIELQELETWKDQQKQNFLTDLRILEVKHVKTMQDEWLVRKRELEEKLQKGVGRCQALAQELQIATNTIKTNKALERKGSELSGQLDGKYRNVSREELSRIVEKVEAENKGLKEIINDLRKEIQQIKKTALTKEQTTSLLQQLRGLEEKFEEAKQSKTYFKEQWKKAVREIHHLKAEDHKQMQQSIHRNKEELSQYSLDKFFADGSGDDITLPLKNFDNLNLHKLPFDFKGKY